MIPIATIAALILPSILSPSMRPETGPLLDAAVTEKGKILTVALEKASTGGKRPRLVVSTNHAGEVSTSLVTVTRIPPGAEIVEARIAPFRGPFVVLGLAVRKDETTSYHFLHNGAHVGREEAEPGGWLFSRAIFTSQGDPFRIAEVHNPGGDSLEMIFRRGTVDPHSRRAVEVLMYSDSCPIFRDVDVPGRTRLFRLEEGDAASADRVSPGKRSR